MLEWINNQNSTLSIILTHKETVSACVMQNVLYFHFRTGSSLVQKIIPIKIYNTGLLTEIIPKVFITFP